MADDSSKEPTDEDEDGAQATGAAKEPPAELIPDLDLDGGAPGGAASAGAPKIPEPEAPAPERQEAMRPMAPPPTRAERGRWLDSLLKRLDDEESLEPRLPSLSSTAALQLEESTASAPDGQDANIADISEIAEIQPEEMTEVGPPPTPQLPPPIVGTPLPPPAESDQAAASGEDDVEIDVEDTSAGSRAEAPPAQPAVTEPGVVPAPAARTPEAAADAAGAEDRTPVAPPPTHAPEPAPSPLTDEVEEPPERPRSPLEEAVAAARQDEPERLETALVQELDAEEDRSRKAVIQHELGHLLHERQHSESRAVKAYAQALNLDPLLRPNVWAVRRVFVVRQLWSNLLKLHDAEVRFEEDAARRAEILLEKGWILQDRLGDVPGAREAFQAAHEAHPTWLAPLLALEGVALEVGDLGELADLYRRMVDATDDGARKVALLVDLARLQEKLTDGTPQRSLELYEQALQVGHDRAWVLELMERAALAAGLHRELVQILERQAAAAVEATAPELAAAKLRHAALIADAELEDPRRAQELLGRALEIRPDDPILQRDLLQLAEAGGDHARAEALLARRLELSRAPAERAALHHRIGLGRLAAAGSAPADQGDQTRAGAREAFRRALEELPGYLPVLLDEERACLERSDMAGLVEAWLREAEAVERRAAGLPLADAADAAWGADALWRAARVLARELGQPARAIELCQRALRLQPGLAVVVDELEWLLRASGKHGELAAMLEERARQDGSEGRAAREHALESLVALYAGTLDDPERLVSTLRQLLELRPRDRRLRRRLADVLERLERYPELEQTLREIEEVEGDEELQLGCKLARAQLYEGPLAKPEAAIATYWEVLARQSQHLFAFAALESLLWRAGRFDELARLLRQTADRCPAGVEGEARRAELLRTLGTIHERRLGDSRAAVEVYSELLAMQPRDADTLAALERAARAARDHAKLAEALETRGASEGDAGDRALLSLRLAEVYESELADPQRAEEAMARAVELAPDKLQVVDALELALRRRLARGDYAETAPILEELQRLAPPGAEQLLLEERAWIAGGPLRDGPGAAKLWSELADADNPRRLFAQTRLAARSRDTAELARLQSRLAARSTDQAATTALELRAGAIGSDVEALRRVLGRTPDEPEALLGLLASSQLSPAERAELGARVARLAPEPAREEMRLALAETLERAGHFAAALPELAAVLATEPQNLGVAVIVQRIAAAVGDREREAKAWVQLGTLYSDRTAKAEAFARASDLLEELGLPADAALVRRQVLALHPADRAAYDRLHALYSREGDLAGLEQLLSHRLHSAQDAGARIALHFERAELRLEKRGDRVGATRDLLQILRLEPKHMEALRQLSRLYDEDGNARRALELYQRYVDAAESPSLKRPAVLRMAELLHGKLGRSADAVDICRRFLELVPEDERVLEQLVELYTHLRDYPHAISMLERLAELRPDRRWKAGLLRRAARIYSRDMKDHREARDTLLRARDLDPTEIEIVHDLRQLGPQLGGVEELGHVLERAEDDLREALAASPVSVELYRKLMRVAEWREDTYTLLAAMGALCFLNAADPEDADLYRRRIAKVAFEPKHQLGIQALRETLVDRSARGAYGELWAVIADSVSRLYEGRVPADPAHFGAGRGERVDRKAGGPVSATLDRMAAAVGLSDFDIYLQMRDQELVAGVVGDRPALIVGGSVVTGLDAARRFRIGRTLSLLRDRAFALEILSHAELELVFSAVIFTIEPGASFSLPRGEVEAQARRVAKILPRKAKRALPLAVTRFMQEGGDLQQWIDGVLATANRAGLLVSGDILAAMTELVEPLRSDAARAGRSSDEIGALIGQRKQAAQLLTFSVGREYLGLRKELQL